MESGWNHLAAEALYAPLLACYMVHTLWYILGPQCKQAAAQQESAVVHIMQMA